MRIIKYIWLAVIIVCALACGQTAATKAAYGDVVYKPTFAEGFVIYAGGENSTIMTVLNPWQGASDVEYNLFLSREGELPPEGFDGIVLNAPIQKVVCMSSTYVAYLDAVGEIDAVKAVSGAKYISNDTIRARYSRGDVKDIGYDTNMDFELIASLRPDIVLAYGVSSEEASLSMKLKEMGINLLYIGDYLEQSPMGKAEWMIAFGEMFDKRSQAESFFAAVASEYHQIKEEVLSHIENENVEKPIVMLNDPYRDVWYVPGDKNYMTRLINDAGGEYACAGVDSEQTRPISAEAAFVAAGRSDVWMNPGQANTLKEVVSLNPRFSKIPAVINNRVYNCNARQTPEGGSDFWESGAVRPDIVLNDIAAILYPGLYSAYELHFFKHLK